MTVIPARATDIFARTNADFDQTCQIWADAARTTPRDLTGWTFAFAIRAKATDAAALIDATSANGRVVVLNAALGQFAIRIDRALLAAAMPIGAESLNAVYDLRADGPGDAQEVWLAGRFLLSLGIAR